MISETLGGLGASQTSVAMQSLLRLPQVKFSRFVIFLACLSVSALSMAQMGRWQLGNPSLIVDLPGDPHAGGVAWHERSVYNILPTSWSAENEDAKVEVSSVYSADTAQTLANQAATKLGTSVSNGQTAKVSGQDAYRFNAGPRLGLAIAGGGRGWIVIGTAKTPAGADMVRRSLTSVLVERAGKPRWVRRSLGGTRMHAELPFDFAEDFSKALPNDRRAYELFWNDLEITAFVESPTEGHKVDYEATVKGYIDGESKQAGTEAFKSKRERVKLDKLNGDIVTLDFQRNNKPYRIRAFFALDGGPMLRMSIVTNPSRPDHEASAERIVSTFRVSGVNFNGFEPRQVGSEPISLDLPKAPESKGNGLYSVFVGAFGVDIRVTPINPANGHNADQLATMLTAKFQGRADIKDFKSDTSKRLVDGIEARMVRASYKSKSGMKTHEVALALFSADAIYVVEAIVGDNEVEYLERIFDSVRFEARAPSGWRLQQVGESGLSVFWSGKAEGKTESGTTPDMEKTITYQAQQAGCYNWVIEQKFKSAPPQPGLVLPLFAKALADGMGGTYEMLDQRPIDVGPDSGLHAKLNFTLGGNTLPGDMIVVKRGTYLWTLVVIYDPAKGGSVLRQALVNSIQ